MNGRWTAGLWLAWALAGPSAGAAQDRADTLRIALVAPADEDVALGVRLGVEETRHTGALLGLTVELVADTAGARPSALVGGADDAGCRALAEAASRSGIPYLNTGCAAPGLRDAAAYPAAFHIVAADTAGGATAGELWRSSLTRYGAAQLNERFTGRFHRPMTSGAWAGWMAVKVLAEAALRARSADGAAIAAHLRLPQTRFDGHKGVPLVFGPDHQLVQPLYAAADTPAGE